MNRFYPVLCVCSLAVLSACTPLGLATGVGATAGVAASQEGGLSRAAVDARIQLAINELWFQYDVDTFSKLDLTVNDGRVLITGVVQDPAHRVEAVRLAWQPKGVKQVINEIQVAKSDGIVGFAKDTWITTRLRTALTFNKNVLSINYSIDTVRGTVYLMGYAQSREELNRVVETARTINGVVGVVSYVKFVGVSAEDVVAAPAGNNAQSQDFQYQNHSEPQAAPAQNYDSYYGAPAQDAYPNEGYPNNVQPMYQNQGATGQPMVIQGDPMAPPNPQGYPPQPGVQTYPVESYSTPTQPATRSGVESEQLYWNGQQ